MTLDSAAPRPRWPSRRFPPNTWPGTWTPPRHAPVCPWSVLAGIGKVESDNGESSLPGVQSGANSAGAEGPMQFLPATFAAYAVNADPGQPLTPYDPADAIYTAPGCCAPTAPAAAQRLASSRPSSPTTTPTGTSPTCWPGPPGTRPRRGTGAVATAIAFAEAQLGKPYCWGGQGPACFDCSGLVFAAYAAAGIHIARTTYQWQQDGPQIPLSQIQPGDLLFSAGSDGTPTNPGHVVMYLGGGQVIQAPETGEDVQIDPSTWPPSWSPPGLPTLAASP